jgi:hypothetical protein
LLWGHHQQQQYTQQQYTQQQYKQQPQHKQQHKQHLKDLGQGLCKVKRKEKACFRV